MSTKTRVLMLNSVSLYRVLNARNMKLLVGLFFGVVFLFTACKEEKKASNEVIIANQENVYTSFGDEISEDKAITTQEMLRKFKSLKEGDTIKTKFVSEIKEVCSKKGCWMKLSLSKEAETMVRFKDYAFFMPLDSQGKKVILNGKAFVKITTVAELQHYAEDAGKSKEEVAKITSAKKEFAFEADGVLLKTK
jgi:hypothetical protein